MLSQPRKHLFYLKIIKIIAHINYFKNLIDVIDDRKTKKCLSKEHFFQYLTKIKTTQLKKNKSKEKNIKRMKE